jgi:hypothetical protein
MGALNSEWFTVYFDLFRIDFCLTFSIDRTPKILFLSYDNQLESNKHGDMHNSINFKYQLVENNLYGKYHILLLYSDIVRDYFIEYPK